MTNATNYSYDRKFENIAIGMGLKHGMFSFNDNGYISPITRQLYEAHKSGHLTASLVNTLLELLK